MYATESLGRIQGKLMPTLQFHGMLIDEAIDHRAKDVVASMIKRLAHRNANVQLYTLEVGHRSVDLVDQSSDG